jgi:NADH-quinone oxidoreductase subunit L
MILAGALEKGMVNPHHMIIFLALLISAGVTAFYMFRLIFMTFTGEPRDRHAYDHARESPALMWVPLALLAILSVVAGYDNIGMGGFFKERIVPYGQEIHYGGHEAEHHPGLLTQAAYAVEEHPEAHSAAEHDSAVHHAEEGHGHGAHDDIHHKAHVIAMTLSIIVATVGIVLSAFTYWERIRVIDPGKCARALGPVYDLVYNKYYVDEFYDRTLYKGTEVLRNFLARFDQRVVDGIVNGTATVTVKGSNKTGWFDNKYIDGIVNWLAVVSQRWGTRASRVETGVIQNYVLKVGSAVGAIVVLWIVARSYAPSIAEWF